MSDNWLIFIPDDPSLQPAMAAADEAVTLLRAFVPAASEVAAKFTDDIEFHNGGENWSGVVKCSNCDAEIEDWWIEAMEKAYASEFNDINVVVPCCGQAMSLNNLNYEWPAGFSRFRLEAMNPRIRDTTPEQDRALADALGFGLRKIWMHI